MLQGLHEGKSVVTGGSLLFLFLFFVEAECATACSDSVAAAFALKPASTFP